MDSLSTVKANDNQFQSMSNATVSAIDDVEISIFDAAKYFNEGLNDVKRQVDEKKVTNHHHHHHLLQPSVSSPAELGRKKSSALSEASWSSQIALLTASRRWSAAKRWFLRRRRRNCCCSNGESIRVKEVIARPIVLMDTVKSKASHADADADADADDVVEIRQIRASDAPRQQRISATGRPFISAAAAVGFTFPILSSAAREDDAGSDASSDLFEIETFSAQTPSSLSSCPIHCLCDSHAERKFTPPSNVHRSRLSAATAAGCDGELEENAAASRPTQEEAGGGRGRRKSVDGGATAAEGPASIPSLVGGRPVPAEKLRRGSSRSPPLVAAGG